MGAPFGTPIEAAKYSELLQIAIVLRAVIVVPVDAPQDGRELRDRDAGRNRPEQFTIH